MKLYTLFIFVLLCFPYATKGGNSDTLLRILDSEIERRPQYLITKTQETNLLRQQLRDNLDNKQRFEIQSTLCLAYQSFAYDTTTIWVKELLKTAQNINEPDYFARANTQKAFALLSAGFFQQAIDVLEQTKTTDCTRRTKSHYYFTLARSYYDLLEFYNDQQPRPIIVEKGNLYLDSAIANVSLVENNILFLSYSGLKALRLKEDPKAIGFYEQLINDKGLSVRQSAIEAACLSYLYGKIGDSEKSLKYILQSAIADQKSAVRESTALLYLSKYFYAKGDYSRASYYIKYSLEDANAFGARQRQVQILEILPIIEAAQYKLIQTKRDQLIVFILILGVLLAVCAGLAMRLFQQKQKLALKDRKLEVAYKALEEQIQKLALKDQKLEIAYKKLEEQLVALSEAQSIKEKYIGYFFQTNNKNIQKTETLLTKAKEELAAGKYSDVKFTLDQFKVVKERQKILTDFDHAFLTVFPDFVAQFNELFDLKDQFSLTNAGTLNTELRIFALIRLGIHNNEVIANALNYSINTIYTYKTKIRNKSLLENEAFDAAVLSLASAQSKP
jgi:Domain of unknown function (DUF6377)